MYTLYILQCTDGSLYTGITVDVERRIKEHNASLLGAKYTRSRRPVQLVFAQKFPDRASASAAEWRIKKLSRTQKLALIQGASEV